MTGLTPMLLMRKRKEEEKAVLNHSGSLPGGSDGKESPCSAGDLDSIPGSEKIP